jgi:hypothetical protein
MFFKINITSKDKSHYSHFFRQGAGSAAEREVLAIIAPVTGIGRFSNKNKKYFVLK